MRGIYERIKYIMIMVRQRLIIKIEHKTLSKTELTFFENERTLKCSKYCKNLNILLGLKLGYFR